jgi:hypothetical protein
LRALGPAARAARPRRRLRTLPLVAAALGAASLAAAGGLDFLFKPKVGEQSTFVTTSARPGPSAPNGVPTPRASANAPNGVPTPRASAAEAAPVAVGAEAAPPASSGPAVQNGARLGARSSSAREYANELALLEPARSSIARGEYQNALAAIATHRREFPNGTLTEEREALRVRALWGVGQRPAATAAAAAFRKRYPRSVLLGWMKDQAREAP